jgi:hypothetical protein
MCVCTYNYSRKSFFICLCIFKYGVGVSGVGGSERIEDSAWPLA